ncbi:MAG: hypothetical protein Q9221_000731 [Calogaya cf. arnoldii]
MVLNSPRSGSSVEEKPFCSQHFYCLTNTSAVFISEEYEDNSMVEGFLSCLKEKYDVVLNRDDYPERNCHIDLSQFEVGAGEGITGSEPCDNKVWQLTPENWRSRGTDEKLLIALEGGVDSLGVYWEGGKEGETFAETMGRQFWDQLGNTCTIRNPCEPDLFCTQIGSYRAVSLGQLHNVMPLPWVLLVSSALKNINTQLVNQYNELKDAIESLALDTFSIDDFFPKKDQNFPLRNILAGISSLFSILGGLVPVVGTAFSTTSVIAGGVATFYGNALAASSDPLEAQKIFSQKVLGLYRASLPAMENLAEKLFAGDPIPGPGSGSFTIVDLLRGGAWVDPHTITKSSELNGKLRIEALSRSIDSLWKTPPGNKMWVLFTDLGDDANSTKCAEDTTGPPDSKYCANGGVYYTYNFIERSNEGGGVGWLWGADKLQPKANISLKWVTEASAKSYRLMKEINQDPFQFNHTIGTPAFLSKAFTAGETHTDLSEMVGRFPGSWTPPVCDASTWGNSWNWDYTGEKNDIRESHITHPPCMCGPQGLETYDWAKAAGLAGFKTFQRRCMFKLREKIFKFEWPEGVTFVNYPGNTDNTTDNEDFVVWKPE